MAYNILKGNVEFTGDNGSLENTVRTDNANQSIDGKKTFLQRITASAITLNGSNLTAPAVTSVTNAAAGRVALFNGAAGLSGSSVFTYAAGGVLSATIYSGSGAGLTNIRTDQFQGYISASNLVLGNGLKSDSGVLVVSGGAGISITATGVKPNLDTYGGLNLNGTTLMLDTSVTRDISNGGQSLAQADKLFVQDVAGASPAAPQLRSMTVGTLTSYLQSNLTFSPITTYGNAGQHRLLVGAAAANTVNGASALTFDGSILTVSGNVRMDGPNRILSGGVIRAASGAFVVDSRLAVGTPHAPAYDVSVYSTASANMFINGVTDANCLIGVGGTSYGGLKLLGSGDIAVANTQAGKDIILDVNGVSDALRIVGTGANHGITASLNMKVDGRLRGKSLHYTTHKWTQNSNNAIYVRFDTIGSDSPNPLQGNKMIAPHNGVLVKVLARASAGPPGSTAISFHKASDGSVVVSSTATETITVNMASNNTTYGFDFTATSAYNAGDIVGIKFNPTTTPDTVVMTCVWEYDQNN